jgi:CheY-like chemotaxis protein
MEDDSFPQKPVAGSWKVYALVADDNERWHQIISQALGNHFFVYQFVKSCAEAKASLMQRDYDIIITDTLEIGKRYDRSKNFKSLGEMVKYVNELYDLALARNRLCVFAVLSAKKEEILKNPEVKAELKIQKPLGPEFDNDDDSAAKALKKDPVIRQILGLAAKNMLLRLKSDLPESYFQDQKWLEEKYHELVTRHSDKWVIIKGGRILSEHATRKDAKEELDRRGLGPGTALLEYLGEPGKRFV